MTTILLVAAVAIFILLVSIPRTAYSETARRREKADQADRLIGEAESKRLLGQNDAEAQALLTTALRLAQESGDPLLAAEACYGLGDIHMKRREFDAAVGMFELSLREQEELKQYKPNFVQLLNRRLEEARKAAGKS